MSKTPGGRVQALAQLLEKIVGKDAVVTDSEQLRLLSSDIYSAGTTAALAIAPSDRKLVATATRAITAAGFAVFPRGGGMSYTGGYLPDRDNSVVVDTSRLNNIIDVSSTDMTITVEAGVTWQQIYAVLAPMNLRLPFFGTFSGSRATVGGGMSNGALFMGTARYGTGADIALGLEVVTASGKTIRTGQAAVRNGKPFYRTYGPDLTGLFLHDAGALGIKTTVTLRLIQNPAAQRFASFVFSSVTDVVSAMSELARSGRVEEVYVFDPEATRRTLDSKSLKSDLGRLLNVVKSQGTLKRGIKEGAALVGAGRKFVPDDVFSLHIVCAAPGDAGAEDDLTFCRSIVSEFNGGEIANSMPKTARANPFGPLNEILGSHGDRWVALNAKVAHSDALGIVNATDELLTKYAARMQAHDVSCTRLFIGISSHAFSFEPVLRWHDEWLPLHRDVPEPSFLNRLTEPRENLEARELVHEIRGEIIALFARTGAASNQIGRTYPYFESLLPDTANLLTHLKRTLDPEGLMNPGALGLFNNDD